MREKWRLFRREREDPEPFYSLLAREAAADLDRRHGPLRGQRVLDLGCGPGFYTAALEIGLLAFVGANLTEVAIVLFGLQLFCAGSILTLSLRARPRETLAT